MKSILGNKKVNITKRYPYVGIHKTDKDNFIVLFTEKDTGIVIHREDGGDLGEYSIAWNEECFSPYEYAVSLSN